MEAEGSPETLENLVLVTQNQEPIFQNYYTNDSGEVVTMSVYDISTTDPGLEYVFNIFSCSLKKSSHERNWDKKNFSIFEKKLFLIDNNTQFAI